MDISGLTAFACVAKHRSFRRAATERGVSPSALSHAVRSLEETLGIRLLSRTSRSVQLTEAGEHLLLRLVPAMNEIVEALDSVNRYRDTAIGTLRLNVPRSAVHMVLAPLIGPFLTRHPGAKMEIVTDDGLVDIVRDGFDAGIRVGEKIAREMIAVPVGPRRQFAVVGSPAYFEEHGRPETPYDLTSHACIGRRYPGGAHYAWQFERNGRPLEVSVNGSLVVDDAALMIQGALDGLGLAYVYEDQVSGLVSDGRLIRVLEDWCPLLPGFFLYYPSRRQMPALLRAFIDMIANF